MLEREGGSRPGSGSEKVHRLRVAVGSADGKFVHEHFGRATCFQIFDLTGNTLQFVECRSVSPACGTDGHDDDRLAALVESVSDADVVLVAAIGPAAQAALAARRIRAFAVQDFIPDAMRALQRAFAQSRVTTRNANP